MADKKKTAPDEKAPVKVTVNNANQLYNLAAMLDQVYDSTASVHGTTIINHPERGQMRLNQVLDHVTQELRGLAGTMMESASASDDDSDELPPAVPEAVPDVKDVKK
jgi:hypothetical protein